MFYYFKMQTKLMQYKSGAAWLPAATSERASASSAALEPFLVTMATNENDSALLVKLLLSRVGRQ